MDKNKVEEKQKFVEKQNSTLQKQPKEIRNNPWKTILVYILFGFSWIIFSDRFLLILVSDHETFITFQTYKGWFYVLFTAGLLYLLIIMDNRTVFRLTKSISEKNQELVGFSEEMIAIEEELKFNIDALNVSLNAVNQHQKYIEDIFNNSNTIMLVWSQDGIILDVNQYFLNLTQFEKKEVVGKCWSNIIMIDEYFDLEAYISSLKIPNRNMNNEFSIRTKENEPRIILWNSKILKDPVSGADNIVSFGIDISVEKEREKEIHDLAYSDKLTGLKNRTVFEMEMTEWISNKQPLTIFYIDFDNFKNLNEVFGHAHGDEFLKRYATNILHQFDFANVYRWSGDEFVFVQKTDLVKDANDTIEELMRITKQKWTLGEIEYYPSISIGVTQYPKDGDDFAELLKNAEMALYKAKEAGKQQCKFYEHSFQSEVQNLITVESTINRTLQAKDFELHYQPVYDLKLRNIVGFEALLRWKSSKQIISTGEFISVAEKTGQIIDIDRWVIDEAFRFLKLHLSDKELILAVNLSAKSLKSHKLISYVEELIERHKINPSQIEFEVTEHSLIENFDFSLKIINELKMLGFKIALDDFGTRFSSLNYLSKIPFNSLKIDKSYIDRVNFAGKDQMIVEQIIQLASKLGLKTVAEGIEEECQAETLQRLGCDMGQGYHLARPMPAEMALKLL
ncbi:putative bifunctional diguanylate cyclase/phosphodiesterase [Fusibacter bizertensis]